MPKTTSSFRVLNAKLKGERAMVRKYAADGQRTLAHLICQKTFGSLTLDGGPAVFQSVLYYEIDDVEKCYMAHVLWCRGN